MDVDEERPRNVVSELQVTLMASDSLQMSLPWVSSPLNIIVQLHFVTHLISAVRMESDRRWRLVLVHGVIGFSRWSSMRCGTARDVTRDPCSSSESAS